MTGWRWAAFGTAYHDYSGKCVGKKKCLDTPVDGYCVVIEYDCMYTIDGYDHYHSFEKLQNAAGGLGKIPYLGLWLWAAAGSLRSPTPYDLRWSFHESTSGTIGIKKAK
jgi:hypothetical protein